MNFNMVFNSVYLNIISMCNAYEIIKEILFHRKSLKSGVYFMLTSQVGLATF